MPGRQAAKMSLEASHEEMPADCRDCLIYATRRGRESGSQSKDASPPENRAKDSGS